MCAITGKTHMCIHPIGDDGQLCYTFFTLVTKKDKSTGNKYTRDDFNAQFESGKFSVHLKTDHGVLSKRHKKCNEKLWQLLSKTSPLRKG